MSRGPKPKYKIKLAAKEYEKFKHITRLLKAPHAEVIRAKIIVSAYEHPDWTNHQISRTVGCTFRTVQKWRHRWNKKHSIKSSERSGAPRFFSLYPEGTSHGSSVVLHK
jgi:hypothetical protein